MNTEKETILEIYYEEKELYEGHASLTVWKNNEVINQFQDMDAKKLYKKLIGKQKPKKE